MPETLRAAGLRIGGVDHGFGGAGEAPPAAYRPARARQVHGTAIVWVDGGSPTPAGEADALLTEAPGIAVAVSTADCVPLLIAAPGAGTVAAVHAGWRGTLEGIAGAVARELRVGRGIDPSGLRVALGPSIGGCCFEIERAIAERFALRYGASIWRSWRDRSDDRGGRSVDDGVARGTLDLRAVNRDQLLDTGVRDDAIEIVGPCTFCGDGPFASFRRDGANAGRQLSWIALTPAPSTA